MRSHILLMCLLAGSSGTALAQSTTPPEVLASAKCNEYFTKRVPALATMDAIRSAGGGYVVASYELDGTGKASAVRVAESVPPGAFEALVVDALQKSEFTPGVKMSGCRYVAEFYSVKRRYP
jgi:hypothetical protein